MTDKNARGPSRRTTPTRVDVARDRRIEQERANGYDVADIVRRTGYTEADVRSAFARQNELLTELSEAQEAAFTRARNRPKAPGKWGQRRDDA